MVEAALRISENDAAARPAARVSGAPGVQLFGSWQDMRETYAKLAARVPVPAPQSIEWLDAWFSDDEHEGVFAVLGDGTRPVAALALEIVRRHGMTVLQFPGGQHANGNFAPVDPSTVASYDRGLAEALQEAIRQQRPDIDAILLEQQLEWENGIANPFVSDRSLVSPNVSLAADLSHGFEALLDATGKKRKNKKHRNQQRKLEAAGSYRIYRASNPEEVRALWSAFREMKAERFAKAGIADAFAARDVSDFFLRLFTADCASRTPRFMIEALECGGKIRSVDGYSVSGKRLTIEFGAIAEDELAMASPGQFCKYEKMRDAAQSGFTVFDFSVGDEPYKRQWCRIETWLKDTHLPLSVRGRVMILFLRARQSLVRRLKSNDRLWNAAKRMRAALNGSKGANASDPDTD